MSEFSELIDRLEAYAASLEGQRTEMRHNLQEAFPTSEEALAYLQRIPVDDRTAVEQLVITDLQHSYNSWNREE